MMSDNSTKVEKRPLNNAIANSKRNPYTIWFVVLSFIVPVVLAYIMYFFVDITSFGNHGEILDPIVNIADFQLKDKNDTLIEKSKLIHKWRLISFLNKECDEQCEKRLYDTRQIHKSLGKEQNRLLRMFVHLQPAGSVLTQLISSTHPNIVEVYGDKNSIIKVLGKNIRNNVGISNNETYIMDPLGNVMMRFTVDQPDKDFLRDLKKLLKVSQIG